MSEKPAAGAFDPAKHLTKLKGKDYLEVKYRIQWFRTEHPAGTIKTEHIELSADHAIFRATVFVEPDGGFATGYGSETKRDFGDFIEKAETKAIGRALAALGYGTQFAPDLEEGQRIVDSPVQRAPQASQRPQNAPREPAPSQTPTPANLDRERENKRVHARLDHETVAAALKLKYGLESTRDATAEQLATIADLDEGKGSRESVIGWNQWKEQRAKAKATQNELMPSPDEVPNPDRYTQI